MLINRDKLLGKLRENRLTQDEYAKSLNLTPTGFRNKLGGRQFKENEIARILSDFGTDIFLDYRVEKKDTN